MRKPRDFDSELKALAEKAKQLKERRVRELGALVTATGADALDADVLAGALLDAAENTDKSSGEGWRKRGAAQLEPAHLAPHRPQQQVRL